MKALSLGSKGADVERVQYFLKGQGLYSGAVDGKFGAGTLAAVTAYQDRRRLTVDGVVGNATLLDFMVCGFALVPPAAAPGQFPAKPSFPPLASNAERGRVFGKFDFEPAPTKDNPEAIRITDGWDVRNISAERLPQLVALGLSRSGTVRFHRLAVPQLLALWAAWEKAGLLSLVKSWEGAFVARFVRGSRTTLSNHAFGSAFDINYSGNELGKVPAAKGTPNSVRELVPLAHEHGFYWGGHFSRGDGMHFEIAKIL